MSTAIIISIISLAIIITIRIRYIIWKKSASKVMDEGNLMDIPSGKIHYRLTGKGPVLFFMHGGPGGIDQDNFIKYLIDEGYAILIVSRPGYLQTPFQALSYEQQVDQYVELLDKLNIDKVVPIGVSAGGPLALNLANKYPERTHALIMEAGVSTVYDIPSNAEDSFWMKLFLNDGIQDILSWLSIIMVKAAFKFTFKSMLSLETLIDKEGIDKFATLVAEDDARRNWIMNLIISTSPMSIRKLGLDHDVELMTSIKKIPVDNIHVKSLLIYSRDDNDVKWLNAEYLTSNLKDYELLETHGGHLMWVGEDMDKIKAKRVGFLKTITFDCV
ncbi:MAG: alpha/beta hydrolase [Anaerolineales bacterium]